jgi:hypothetical protein
MITKQEELLENYFADMRIKQLDISILGGLGAWDTENNLSPAYYSIIKSMIIRFNDSCKNIDYISYKQIIEFLTAEKERVTYKTFYVHLQAFKKILFSQPVLQIMDKDNFEFFKAIFDVALKINQFVNYELLREKVANEPAIPLNQNQINTIINQSSLRTALLFEFLIRSGARVNQLVKIKKKSIVPHPEEPDIILIEIPVKKGVSRSVVMPDNFIRSIFKDFNEDNEFLFHPATSLSLAHHQEQFSARQAEPMKRSYIYREIKHCSDLLDEFNMSDHPIKPGNILASFIKILSDNGFDDNVICNYLEKGVAAFNSVEAARSILKCFDFINTNTNSQVSTRHRKEKLQGEKR